jgi:hypothetical protein
VAFIYIRFSKYLRSIEKGHHGIRGLTLHNIGSSIHFASRYNTPLVYNVNTNKQDSSCQQLAHNLVDMLVISNINEARLYRNYRSRYKSGDSELSVQFHLAAVVVQEGDVEESIS